MDTSYDSKDEGEKILLGKIPRTTQTIMIKKTGNSELWDRADPDTSSAALKSVYLNPKSKAQV